MTICMPVPTPQNPHAHLDETLPPELRQVVRYRLRPSPSAAQTSEVAPSEGAGTSARASVETTTPTEASMTTPNTQSPAAAMTREEVAKAVASSVEEILGAKDREQAIAKQIETLVQGKADAIAAKASVEQTLTKANTEIEALKGQVAAADAAKKDAEKKAADKDAELDDAKKKFAKAKADLDEANGRLTKIAVTQAVASRQDAITKSGLKLDNFTKKAVATKEDGSLAMDDATFNETLADYVANAPKAPETAGNGTAAQATATQTATNPTNAAPAIPGAAAAAAPAAPAGTAQATASTTAPAAPDLSAIDGYTRATAALMGAANATTRPDGVSKYAKMFGDAESPSAKA